MIKIQKYLSEESLAIIALTIVILVSFYIFHSQDKWESLPPFFLTCVTAIFSFFAYKHSKEKFRLELMDKRLEIYKNISIFCSVVSTEGGLTSNDRNAANIERGHKAAYESFRGNGYHQSRMLFGKDIEAVISELNNHYGWLGSYTSAEDMGDRSKWASERTEKLMRIFEINSSLPEIFKPYIYFGNYKN